VRESVREGINDPEFRDMRWMNTASEHALEYGKLLGFFVGLDETLRREEGGLGACEGW